MGSAPSGPPFAQTAKGRPPPEKTKSKSSRRITVAHPPDNPTFVGTDVALEGVSDADIATAKNFFLKFSNEPVLDETSYGQILARGGVRNARIYVTGMLVAEEENFAFSYNITSLTATM